MHTILLTDAASVVNAGTSLVHRSAYGSGTVYQRKQSGNYLNTSCWAFRYIVPDSDCRAPQRQQNDSFVISAVCSPTTNTFRTHPSGELEMDESPFGGARKGKRGWGAAGKILVFGIMKRNGKVHLSVVPNRKYKTLRQQIHDHTKTGSLYYTDDYGAAPHCRCGETTLW